MEKLTHTPQKAHFLGFAISLVLLCMVGFSTNTFAAQDTTVFRIKVLQDSVYAGDTVDVEFYIGSGTPGLTALNLLKQFEIEAVTDTSLIVQDRTTFAFDYTSLSSFFATTLSNITSSYTLNTVLGNLNMKAGSNRNGSGDARVGKGKYIVQDNAAGRHNMKYSFTKAISKNLLGLSNPVKVMTDSVVIIGKRKVIKKKTPVVFAVSRMANEEKTNNIKIYPNPTTDYFQIFGDDITQYRLLGIDGCTILSEENLLPETLNVNMTQLNSGMYILMLEINKQWNSYKIIKK